MFPPEIRHSRYAKKCLRPFRAYIQCVDLYIGRCPMLLLMPFQGIELITCLSPERAL
jgi:hypothetical protein